MTSMWWTTATAVRDQLAATRPATYRKRLDSTSDAPCTLYMVSAVGLDQDTDGDLLVVAWSGDPDAASSPGSGDQRTATTGGYTRDEDGRIEVRIVAQDGDRDPEETVARAMSYLGDLESLLTTTPALGVTGVRRLFVEVGKFEVLPYNADGAVAEIDVTLNYSARI